jgi:hypothetical protein
MVKKYIEPQLIEAWIKDLVKRHSNGSIFCRALVNSSPLVGKVYVLEDRKWEESGFSS